MYQRRGGPARAIRRTPRGQGRFRGSQPGSKKSVLKQSAGVVGKAEIVMGKGALIFYPGFVLPGLVEWPLTREQMIDMAVRRVTAPDMLRVLQSGRRSVEFFRRHADLQTIRDEFAEISRRAA